MCFVQTGKVKLSVVSSQSQEAIVALLEPGAFFGEGCLAGQLVCMATAATAEESTIVRIDKQAMPIEEATISNMWEGAAIVEVLERKCLCTNKTSTTSSPSLAESILVRASLRQPFLSHTSSPKNV